ncbi:Unknown protein, partial [Striga hermonthica]
SSQSTADEVEQRLRVFSLSKVENKIIVLGDADVRSDVEECHHSLFGRIVGDKRASLGIKKAMTQIWRLKSSLEVRELGANFFQFIFANVADLQKVEGGTNWIFENQFLILRRWEPGMNSSAKCFSELNLWVQVHNVPLNWMTAEVGLKIGQIFKDVSNVVVTNLAYQGGRLIKLLVTVDLNEPLPRCTSIRLGSQIVTVTFKYERLVNLCFYCGMIGHIEKSCKLRMEDIKNKMLHEGQFGEWLRATEGLHSQNWNQGTSSSGQAKEPSSSPTNTNNNPNTNHNEEVMTNDGSAKVTGHSQNEPNGNQATSTNEDHFPSNSSEKGLVIYSPKPSPIHTEVSSSQADMEMMAINISDEETPPHRDAAKAKGKSKKGAV